MVVRGWPPVFVWVRSMKNPFSKWSWLGRSKEPATATPDAPRSGPDRPDVPPTTSELAAIRPEEYVGADQAKNERLVREKFADKAKQFLGRLPMAREVVAMYFCMLDPKTPIWVKGTVAGALAYFILPLDAIPDLLPLFGLSDDAAILTAALTAIAAYITDEHYRRADAWMAVERIEPGPGA